MTRPTLAPNTLFPGRPDYTGPTIGLFGLLHHTKLCEFSHNVALRVAYVKRKKPRREIPTRLHNMIYLGACEAKTKREKLHTLYLANSIALILGFEVPGAFLAADYEAQLAPIDAEILAYIRLHIPDCAWDGTQIVFA